LGFRQAVLTFNCVRHSTEHSSLKVFTANTKRNLLHEHEKLCTIFCNKQNEAKNGDLMIPLAKVQQITAISMVIMVRTVDMIT
jgi:hypothetical protein